jgi:hypothetical protein
MSELQPGEGDFKGNFAYLKILPLTQSVFLIYNWVTAKILAKP